MFSSRGTLVLSIAQKRFQEGFILSIASVRLDTKRQWENYEAYKAQIGFVSEYKLSELCLLCMLSLQNKPSSFGQFQSKILYLLFLCKSILICKFYLPEAYFNIISYG